MTAYLDTSAAMKLVIAEPESEALVSYLQAMPADNNGLPLVASWLLHTELHCAANRHPQAVNSAGIAQVLDSVALVDLTRGDLQTAGVLPGALRSNEAVHLAVALRLGVDELITYDNELARAAAAAGLAVVGPS